MGTRTRTRAAGVAASTGLALIGMASLLASSAGAIQASQPEIKTKVSLAFPSKAVTGPCTDTGTERSCPFEFKVEATVTSDEKECRKRTVKLAVVSPPGGAGPYGTLNTGGKGKAGRNFDDVVSSRSGAGHEFLFGFNTSFRAVVVPKTVSTRTETLQCKRARTFAKILPPAFVP